MKLEKAILHRQRSRSDRLINYKNAKLKQTKLIISFLKEDYLSEGEKELTRERNIRIVQSFFRLIERKKIKEISELYAENGKNIAPYHSGLFPAEVTGKKEIYKFWKAATAQFGEISFPIDEIMPFEDPNKVAVKLVGKLKFRDDRGKYENDYFLIFNFDGDGKILEFYEYYNPIAAARAFGLMNKIE